MYWNVFAAALLALAPVEPPLQVDGCALLANPNKFEGKIVKFVAHRMPAIETLDYAPFGCAGIIGIFDEPAVMRDHRLPLEGAYQSRSGFMVPATRIEGHVRVERAPAVPGRFEAMTFVLIEHARIEPAGYRRAETVRSAR